MVTIIFCSPCFWEKKHNFPQIISRYIIENICIIFVSYLMHFNWVQYFRRSGMYFTTGSMSIYYCFLFWLIIHVWDDMFVFDEDLAASLIDDNDGGIMVISNGLTGWLPLVSIEKRAIISHTYQNKQINLLFLLRCI